MGVYIVAIALFTNGVTADLDLSQLFQLINMNPEKAAEDYAESLTPEDYVKFSTDMVNDHLYQIQNMDVTPEAKKREEKRLEDINKLMEGEVDSVGDIVKGSLESVRDTMVFGPMMMFNNTVAAGEIIGGFDKGEVRKAMNRKV